ncbi:MAG: hypothetical protein NVS1B13_07720 [Flavisolibacter sp.]
MKKALLFILILSGIFTISCKKSNSGLTATTTLTSTGGNFGGDVTGNGGANTQSFTWNNTKTSANYSMDLTAVNTNPGCSFELIIKDANGTVVYDKTLIKGQTVDSYSGVTNIGVVGNWTVVVILKSFNGNGSFSMSPGP